MIAIDPNDAPPASLLNPHVADLEPYKAVRPIEVLSERLGVAPEDIVKLDANENPYGPLPAVTDALASYRRYHVYPDPQQEALRDALAGYASAPAERILIGQGADELLDLLCRLFLGPGDAVVTTPPTFGMYRFDARLQGAEVLEVPRRADYSLDVPGIARAVSERAASGAGPVKLLFLASPNNPTGHWLPDEVLRDLLALPVMVVLDEAYVEFADRDTRAGWLDRHENLAVLRTFSKAAGIAGLRLGYGIFPDWLTPTLWKFKQPYNVSVAATVAGLASLAHADQLSEVVQTIVTERSRLGDALRSVGWLEPVEGSQANFLLCRVHGRDARAVQQALEARAVLVRHYDSAGLEGCLRISVGRPEHTDALVRALQSMD